MSTTTDLAERARTAESRYDLNDLAAVHVDA